MPAKAEYTLSSLTLPVEEALEALILISQNKAEISKALQQTNEGFEFFTLSPYMAK